MNLQPENKEYLNSMKVIGPWLKTQGRPILVISVFSSKAAPPNLIFLSATCKKKIRHYPPIHMIFSQVIGDTYIFI